MGSPGSNALYAHSVPVHPYAALSTGRFPGAGQAVLDLAPLLLRCAG